MHRSAIKKIMQRSAWVKKKIFSPQLISFFFSTSAGRRRFGYADVPSVAQEVAYSRTLFAAAAVRGLLDSGVTGAGPRTGVVAVGAVQWSRAILRARLFKLHYWLWWWRFCYYFFVNFSYRY